jgi:hypothetical protein
MADERLQALDDAKRAVMTEMKRQADLHNLSDLDVLALCAFMTGAVVALQDQRKMTPAQALEFVGVNIEAGNRSVLKGLLGQTAGRA